MVDPLNDITILLLYAIFSRNHGYRLDICETVTHNHLSEYFCTFKINIVDICKILLRLLNIPDLWFYYLQEHVKWANR